MQFNSSKCSLTILCAQLSEIQLQLKLDCALQIPNIEQSKDCSLTPVERSMWFRLTLILATT